MTSPDLGKLLKKLDIPINKVWGWTWNTKFQKPINNLTNWMERSSEGNTLNLSYLKTLYRINEDAFNFLLEEIICRYREKISTEEEHLIYEVFSIDKYKQNTLKRLNLLRELDVL